MASLTLCNCSSHGGRSVLGPRLLPAWPVQGRRGPQCGPLGSRAWGGAWRLGVSRSMWRGRPKASSDGGGQAVTGMSRREAGSSGQRRAWGGGARLPGRGGSVLKRVLWGQSGCPQPVRMGCPALPGWRRGALSKALAGAGVPWVAGSTCSLPRPCPWFSALPQAAESVGLGPGWDPLAPQGGALTPKGDRREPWCQSGQQD